MTFLYSSTFGSEERWLSAPAFSEARCWQRTIILLEEARYMGDSKTFFAVSACLTILLALAACGAAPTASSNRPSPGQTTYQAPSAPYIQVATATLKNKPKAILTTAPGLTLYYLTTDTSTMITCQGSCAAIWRPLLFAGSETPLAPSTLPGKLSLLATANGNQVEYNGHPLYTYTKDMLPGQINGEGVQGKWFVATPDLPKI
jgi:predicted lipoprotein with Yx(FWY)xxD motif